MKDNTEKFKEYYNKAYNKIRSNYKSYKDLYKTKLARYKVHKLLEAYRPNSRERILEIGCALGATTFKFAPLCKEIIGIDYSEVAIKIARKLARHFPYKNVKFIVSNCTKTKFRSNYFDLIISADVFEHLDYKTYKKTLVECKRILKKGGKLLIWTPNPEHIIEILKNKNIIFKKDYGHIGYKKMGVILSDLKKLNFKILKADYVESHIFCLSYFERIFKKFIPIFRRRILILASKQ